ncbi:hypothetical protein E4T39_04987 [Aureobasidium subglaciale]|nr:hypothetical protein E4T39_04987 [Aureobasidium subglaciale]
MPPLRTCRECHFRWIACDQESPCAECVSSDRVCTYAKTLVNGVEEYLDANNRNRAGNVMVLDAAPEVPQVASAATQRVAATPSLAAASSLELPIAPLHLWRPAFSAPSASVAINSASGTVFPWRESAAEPAPVHWRDFLPRQGDEHEEMDEVGEGDEKTEANDDDETPQVENASKNKRTSDKKKR